jgi:hypothetical protein
MMVQAAKCVFLFQVISNKIAEVAAVRARDGICKTPQFSLTLNALRMLAAQRCSLPIGGDTSASPSFPKKKLEFVTNP